jgi:hypothetical protein
MQSPERASKGLHYPGTSSSAVTIVCRGKQLVWICAQAAMAEKPVDASRVRLMVCKLMNKDDPIGLHVGEVSVKQWIESGHRNNRHTSP